MDFFTWILMVGKDGFKGNVAVYKDLNLVTVTIKRYFSREHSERM